ncbi:helix-turn-helix domain-containing protein [Paractinoplanes hotanensis]|uniref:Helix-turn-helix domain-containing protein n=1 Tax=Paractinoplanes hotanensis TaxID=2906497 RepID=A0ABT0YHQ6_9ACTN|nr:helix-turn-helix domain-containing protein [Actinoplanes hotanensis]MCM4085038.1 helix-turn-helix domain-containing protein [Actinoplanes hotanensis]
MSVSAPGLGTYLRSLRTRVTPASLGLSVQGNRRRVPGLRREEIAQLAGVSVSYYISLEQGRAEHASPEILGAIARALHLDEYEEGHLLNLATAAQHRRRGPRRRTPRLAPALLALLEAMPGVPAFAHDSTLDVLAWNRVGHALYAPHLDRSLVDQPCRRPNLARMVFLDPWCREFYVDWRAKAESLTAMLRLNAGREPHNTALSDLVGELIVNSPDFERMWLRHRVRACTVTVVDLDHPQVGRLRLTQQALASLATADTVLVTATAEAGSASHERLQLLGSLTAGGPPARNGAVCR